MDYDSIIEKLKNTEHLPSYDLLINLEKIILSENVEILIHELAVFSGVALRFVYSINNPLLYEDIPYFGYNLERFLNFHLETLEINMLKDIPTPFLIIPENLLVIDMKKDLLVVEHVFERYELPLSHFNSNSKILKFTPTAIKRDRLYEKSIFKDVAYEVHRNYYDRVEDSSDFFVGKSAFSKFIKDFESYFKSFEGDAKLIFTRTIPDQLSSLYGLRVYLLGVYHFLDRVEQKVLFEGINSLSDAIMYYRELERIIRDALKRGYLGTDVQRRCINSMRRFVASFEHFLYILDKFI